MERNVFRLANGTTKVLSIVIRNTVEGRTDQIPEAWHRKLVVALAHDSVNIENERLLSAVVLDGDYQIDWQDFLQYPVAESNFKIQVTPFAATNSNCQTCEEFSQLSLVDDYSGQDWAEGETHDFPDVVTDNDNICCYNFTITLVSYNALYFSNVSLTAGGVLTATVLTPVPNIDNVLIATYRVTCEDGSYDEADIYTNITGSSTACPPVSSIVEQQISESSVTMTWTPVAAAPATFYWELFLSSDLGTVIQSGTEAAGSSFVTLTGLSTDLSYTFVLKVDCSGVGTDFSSPVSNVFTLTTIPDESCAEFNLTVIDPTTLIGCTFMNCLGEVTDLTFNSTTSVNVCMLITPGTIIPVYYVGSPEITITYVNLC